MATRSKKPSNVREQLKQSVYNNTGFVGSILRQKDQSEAGMAAKEETAAAMRVQTGQIQTTRNHLYSLEASFNQISRNLINIVDTMKGLATLYEDTAAAKKADVAATLQTSRKTNATVAAVPVISGPEPLTDDGTGVLDFMRGLGKLLRLPKKRPPSALRKKRLAAAKRARRSRLRAKAAAAGKTVGKAATQAAKTAAQTAKTAAKKQYKVSKDAVKKLLNGKLKPLVAKSVSKIIPGVGAVVGGAFVVMRFMDGQWKRGLAELASAGLSVAALTGVAAVPAITAAIVIQAGVLAIDVFEALYGVPPDETPEAKAALKEIEAEIVSYLKELVKGISTNAKVSAYDDNIAKGEFADMDPYGGAESVATPPPPPPAPPPTKPVSIPPPVDNPEFVGRGLTPGKGQQGIKVDSSDWVKNMIMEHEGVRYKPYKDSLGLWTVGVGHLIGDGKTLPPEMNRTFSKEEVMELFDKDFKHHKEAAQKIPSFSVLNEKGQGALIDLTFNMGPTWWKRWPTFTRKMKEVDVEGAAASLEDSKWYRQVGRRAPVVVDLIRQGADEGTTIGQASASVTAAKTERRRSSGGSTTNVVAINNVVVTKKAASQQPSSESTRRIG